MVVAESKLEECLSCGFIFGEDDADICLRCGELRCPKCSVCGCDKRRTNVWLGDKRRIG